jgi:hypothetical protein
MEGCILEPPPPGAAAPAMLEGRGGAPVTGMLLTLLLAYASLDGILEGRTVDGICSHSYLCAAALGYLPLPLGREILREPPAVFCFGMESVWWIFIAMV